MDIPNLIALSLSQADGQQVFENQVENTTVELPLAIENLDFGNALQLALDNQTGKEVQAMDQALPVQLEEQLPVACFFQDLQDKAVWIEQNATETEDIDPGVIAAHPLAVPLIEQKRWPNLSMATHTELTKNTVEATSVNLPFTVMSSEQEEKELDRQFTAAQEITIESKDDEANYKPFVELRPAEVEDKDIIKLTQFEKPINEFKTNALPELKMMPTLQFASENEMDIEQHEISNQLTIARSGQSAAIDDGFLIKENQNTLQAYEEPNDNLQVYYQIQDKLQIMLNKQQNSAIVRLEPEDLGKIEINILNKDNNTHLSFTASLDSTKHILESQIDTLKSLLQSNGLQLGDVNISSNSNFGHGHQQKPNHLHFVPTATSNEVSTELIMRKSSSQLDLYA